MDFASDSCGESERGRSATTSKAMRRRCSELRAAAVREEAQDLTDSCSANVLFSRVWA